MKESDAVYHHVFAELGQDQVIDAVESLDLLSDMRVFPLNSYENRVYQVGIEGEEPLIAKFYRPERWSEAQILEEHQFTLELAALEIPVIPPITREINGTTHSLFNFKQFKFSLARRRGGHAPELEDLDTLYTLGQHLGRIHAVGASASFQHRPSISVKSFAIESRDFLLQNNFLPKSLAPAYKAIANELVEVISNNFSRIEYQSIRLHGDCHPGNILCRPDSLYICDLDDARSGPAIQDLWMLLSGDRMQKTQQFSALLDGYEEFFEFNLAELNLIESLRAMRLMHYAAWLARRCDDPAFKLAFPWFNTERYWAEHVLELKEQRSELDEPVLKMY